jgi:hypothetical protein
MLVRAASGHPAGGARPGVAAPEYPPWSSPLGWMEINRAIRGGIHTRASAADRIRELAGAIHGRLESLWPLLEKLCLTTCIHCPSPCCLSASIWFDFRDLLYLHLNDLSPPDCQPISSLSQTCRFLSPRGCSLPRAVRPWICIWYLCPTQTRRLRNTPDNRYARVRQILQDLKAARRRLEDRFIHTIVAGLPQSVTDSDAP